MAYEDPRQAGGGLGGPKWLVRLRAWTGVGSSRRRQRWAEPPLSPTPGPPPVTAPSAGSLLSR